MVLVHLGKSTEFVQPRCRLGDMVSLVRVCPHLVALQLQAVERHGGGLRVAGEHGGQRHGAAVADAVV